MKFQWIDNVYALINKADIYHEEATDLYFEKIGDLCDDENYKDVDEILKILEINKLPTLHLIGILLITNPYKKNISYRTVFLNLVEEKLNRAEGVEKTKRLLEGLK